MIHIELKPEMKPAQNWFDLVQDYDTALKNQDKNFIVATPTGRNPQVVDLSTKKGRETLFTQLNKRSDTKEKLWRDYNVKLKDNFFYENLVGDKCWFSETKSIGSPLDIEHFRPFKIVTQLDYLKESIFDENTWKILGSPIDAQKTNDEGYYWLVYDWKNYRLSCSDSNSRKRNYFPLFPSTTENEIPVLIDPLIKEDVDLISFEKTSKDEVEVVPAVALPIINGVMQDRTISINVDDIIKYFRAVVSIWIYDLNNMRGIKTARGTVWNETEWFLRRIDANTPINDEIFTEIQKKTNKLREHCGVARQVVREYCDSGRITEEQYKNCFSPPLP